jgi:hypothetical protein
MDEYLVSFAEAMVHTPVDAMECQAYYTVQLIAKLVQMFILFSSVGNPESKLYLETLRNSYNPVIYHNEHNKRWMIVQYG